MWSGQTKANNGSKTVEDWVPIHASSLGIVKSGGVYWKHPERMNWD